MLVLQFAQSAPQIISESGQEAAAVDRKIRELAERGLQNPSSLSTEEIEQACFALHVFCCRIDHGKDDRRAPGIEPAPATCLSREHLCGVP